MRVGGGQNSENYGWILLFLQQDLVASRSMGSEPHKFLKVPIEFNDIRLTVLSTKHNGFWLAHEATDYGRRLREPTSYDSLRSLKT